MRIALVSANSFYFPGGVQEHVKSLYNYLKSKGHYVKVIAPKYKNDEKYGEDFILIGKSFPFPFNAGASQVSLGGRSRIDNILKKKFDIIHFHNVNVFLSREILKKSTSKNVLTIHFLLDASLFYKPFRSVIDHLAEKNFYYKIHGIICVSGPLLKYIPKNSKCIKAVIPNGIDLAKFKPTDEKMKHFDDGKVNILFLGRMVKKKGLNYLLRAFSLIEKKHLNARLIVAGFGKNKKYKKLAKKLKLMDVEFIGDVREEKVKYYSNADIFCSPAIYGESFGIVLLEAMASGKPVVAFANEGYKQVLTGKGAKFLVRPGDINELAKKLEILINNEKLRREMGAWGVKEVERYSWQVVGKRIEDFYKGVLNNGEKT